MNIWKDIPGYEGKYQASTDGLIKSLSYLGSAGVEGILANCPNSKGYAQIILRKDNKPRSWRVHRLIALTFIGPSDLTVNHKNGNKLDNRLENLEYLTNAENMRHAYVTGIRTNPHGEEHGGSKLKESEVRLIRKSPNIPGSGRALAKQFGVSPGLISAIRKGRLWKNL